VNKYSDLPVKLAASVRSLRDFFWNCSTARASASPGRTPVMPEPGIREVCVAAGQDVTGAPAILFDKIRGYQGRRLVTGVHGSWANLAVLLGHPKNTSIKSMFYDIISRWGSEKAQLPRIKPDQAPVHEVRIERDINLYDILPLYRINDFDGGYYIGKANVVSRDPNDPTTSASRTSASTASSRTARTSSR